MPGGPAPRQEEGGFLHLSQPVMIDVIRPAPIWPSTPHFLQSSYAFLSLQVSPGIDYMQVTIEK